MQITILLLVFLVESEGVRREMLVRGVFHSALPHMYVKAKTEMG